MGKFFVNRFLLFIPVFFGITFLSFMLMYIAPSDPVEMFYFSRNLPLPEKHILEEKRKEIGLDKPFIIQYKNWLVKFVKGDLGISYQNRQPVNEKIKDALPYTFKLAGLSMLFTIIISTPLGIMMASNRSKKLDSILRFFSFIISATPNFIFSLFLMYILAIKLKLLPVMSYKHRLGLYLPALCLSLSMSAKLIRYVRATVLDELNKDYIVGARSRGLRENTILYKNVLQNIFLTIITIIGISFGSLLGGTAIIENIFVWPGMGSMVIEAINHRDYPVVQAFVVYMSFIFVFLNILVDMSYRIMDPRVKE